MDRKTLIEPKDDIINLQSAFLRSKSLESRKILGQFFTGFSVSDYMASLVVMPKSKTIRILDAGAGTGILAACTALYCLRVGCKAVHAVLYELDSEAVASLRQTMNIVQFLFCEQLGTFTYEICCEDFIVARPDKGKTAQPFDISVINPPYFKYSAKDSPYAKALADLYHGDPNIYASFMAVVMACMKVGGQMVTITPRSFTNGLYFKGFRKYLLTESALSLIHIFRHRDKVFNNDDSAVLQESIICYFVKGSNADTITIRSSDCDASINNAEEKQYPAHLIIDPSNDQRLIRIPESDSAASTLKQAETFKNTFESAGYFISTGRVVEHRTRQYITEDTNTENTVPLYRSHNVTPLTATWIGNHKKDVSFKLNEYYKKHTIKNATYVLLKRFSSKDEKRRLVASVHLANMHYCESIGFGNKINYIGILGSELSTIEAYGLATVLNSSFMDKYFRCISGNTQVNATEIRVMRFPSREQVKEIGDQAYKLKLFETTKIDSIVNSILGVLDSI